LLRFLGKTGRKTARRQAETGSKIRIFPGNIKNCTNGGVLVVREYNPLGDLKRKPESRSLRSVSLPADFLKKTSKASFDPFQDMKERDIRLKNRDLSWLSFNHRVLQEAGDLAVPLYERIKFLAIFSSNLDEFFRVRVASIRAMQNLKKKAAKKLEFDPQRLLKRIHKVVTLQQEEFGEIFRNQIKKDLKREGIFVVRETELKGDQKEFVRTYFREHVQRHIAPVFLSSEKHPPFLENRQLYLAVRLRRKPPGAHRNEPDEIHYCLLEVPTLHLPRFLVIPHPKGRYPVMFLDDVIRLCLVDIFSHHEVDGAWSFKLTRDAELYMGGELVGDLLEKVKKALSKRSTGIPSRFLFDEEMPKKLLVLLGQIFELNEEDFVPGGRYHNFNDFFNFPNPKHPAFTYEPMPPIANKEMNAPLEMRNDVLLYYPYDAYESVVRFLQTAADDPAVISIKITLYRVAKNSRVVEQVIRAAQNGKSVTAFVEVKARFDEESNIHWAEEMEKAGAQVLYSFPELKVHAKICLVSRKEGDELRHYAYLSTGNFNENAARAYTDFGLFTADERLTQEVEQVFGILCRETKKGRFKHLLVPPFNMRERFIKLIENEIREARHGRNASFIAKMNSLEDQEMIAKLYEASQAGVECTLIVRGICCLIPGVEGMSENIRVISIVDRYLEHARVFVFHNGGEELYYLASADWMRRNLSRRIEVGFPIYDERIRSQVRAILDLQLQDTVKARIINKSQNNKYRQEKDGELLRSQYAIYEVVRSWRE